MASKAHSGPKVSSADLKQEDELQSVVILDNFNLKLIPMTFTKPRALLPLVNIPIIEYTLECLAASGVYKTILYCCYGADSVREYLKNSKWMHDSCTMSLVLVVAEECNSVGDVLRDLETKTLVQTDFILIHGDMLSNVKLQRLMENHKIRKQTSKKAIMTMIYKQSPPEHETRQFHNDTVLAIHGDTQQIVGYQKACTCKKFRLPLSVFDVPTVELRFDLLDCRIAICSTVVPQLMTDNFDFQSLDDLVRGILVSEEILDNTLHIDLLEEDEYAAGVVDEDSYCAISQDVMSRWTYPLTPDNNALGSSHDDRYLYLRYNVYQHTEIMLEHACLLEKNVTIGKASHAGAGTFVTKSVIGKECTIGKEVIIKGCYIYDRVSIGDHCNLTDCIVDTECDIKSNTTVGRFSILGHGVIVGPNACVPSRSVLLTGQSKRRIPNDLKDSYKFKVFDKEQDIYLLENCDDNKYDYVTATGWHVSQIASDDENTSDSDLADDTHLEIDQISEEHDVYYNECIGILRRALEENIITENIILEVNSIKHAYGVQIRELTMLITRALLDLPLQVSKNQLNGQQYMKEFKTTFSQFKSLFINYVKTVSSEKEALLSMEEFAASNETVLSVFPLLLAYVYEVDAVSEEGIMAWWESEDDDQCIQEPVRKTANKFIDWLQTAEEESD